MSCCAKVGSDISRVLYFFLVGKKVILTNGFIKKTNKTPPAEKERAKRYRCRIPRQKGEPVMSSYRDFLEEQLKDPELKASTMPWNRSLPSSRP